MIGLAATEFPDYGEVKSHFVVSYKYHITVSHKNKDIDDVKNIAGAK